MSKITLKSRAALNKELDCVLVKIPHLPRDIQFYGKMPGETKAQVFDISGYQLSSHANQKRTGRETFTLYYDKLGALFVRKVYMSHPGTRDEVHMFSSVADVKASLSGQFGAMPLLAKLDLA